uniref:Derlin n=1 Tax=Rhabditophanes sp. KR3021 TaxID=114890 RepID=A0AC35TRY0_9BILA
MDGVIAFITQMPPVTRTYLGLCLLMSVLIQLQVINPFHLYFNWNLILYDYQIWRFGTSFLYLGSLGFSLLFNLIFSYRYCRMLEEGSFAFRTADFVFLFIYGAVFMILCTVFVNILFLGQAFTIMLVYIWGRRNPEVRLNFFGVLSFAAPYLPYFLCALSILVGNSVTVDLLGIASGHIYYFFEDVYPLQHGGRRFLKAPAFLERLFAEAPLPNVPAEERPGGMEWGADADAH